MDNRNSIRKTFAENEEWQGQIAKTNKKPTIKVNYNVPSGSELRVYQSPVGYSWTYDSFTISGFGSKEVGVNGLHYYVWFKSGDNALSTISTYLIETINDEFAVSVVGMNFTEDGKLLVSGTGGGTGGDASADLQQEQIDVAVASNTAIWQQLSDQTDRLLYDTDIIANSINYSNVAITQRLDNIDVSTNNMEIQLDKLIFTNANLHVRDDRAFTEFQGSNIAQYTKLGQIATSTENIELALDGVSVKLNELQLQSAKYTIEAVPSLAPQTVPAFTSPIAGIEKSEGWYFKNTSTGQASQVYYYSYTNPALQVPSRQFAYQLNSISCGYAVVRLLSINATAGLPTLGIYTRPTGSGDAFPGYYKSRKVYSIPSTAKLTQGMKVMIWWGIQPSLKLHPDVARIELELSSTTGTAAGTELLAYLTVNTDSLALAGNAEYILSAAGFEFGDSLIMDSTFTGESSAGTTAGDATATNQLASNTAICARLDSANLTITNSNLALANRLTTLSSNIGQLYYTGSNLQVQDIKLSNELASLNSTIGQGIYVNMETDPVVSGGVKLHGSTDGNLFVYDAQSNTTLGLIYDEAFATNGVLSDLVSGTQQMYVRIDALNDDSVGIYGYSSSLSMPEAIYTVDNAAKVYVDNTVNSLLLAKNPVDNNVNLLTDIDQRLLANVVVDGTVPVTGTFWQATQPVSLAGSVAVTGTFWQATQPVSIAGTVPISSGSPLDTHIYGSSDGTAWHHIKTNPNGVVATNAIMETDANGALTSENVAGPTESYNALHSWIKNPSINVNARGYAATESAFVPIAVDEDGKVATTVSGAVSVQNAVGQTLAVSGSIRSNLATVDNGHLTSTLSGTGNDVHALDVQVKNTSITAIQKSQPASVQQVLTNEVCNCTGPTDSRGLTTAIDTTGFLYISCIFTVTNYSVSGWGNPSIYIQSSPDGILWFNESSYGVSANGTYKIQVYNVLTVPYIRLYLDTQSITPPNVVQFTISQAYICQK